MRSRLFSIVRVAMVAGSATVCRKQRDEALALQADPRHGAVGNQRRAGQVSRILQDSDKEDQEKNLRRRIPGTLPTPSGSIHNQRCQQRGRQGSGNPLAADRNGGLRRIGDGQGRHKDRTDDSNHHGQEEQRAAHGMEKDRIQAARPFGAGRPDGSQLWCRRRRPTRDTSARRAAPAKGWAAVWPSRRPENRGLHQRPRRRGY